MATALDAAPIEDLIGNIEALVPAPADNRVQSDVWRMGSEVMTMTTDVRGLLSQVDRELTNGATPKLLLKSVQQHEDRGWAELLELLDSRATAISAGQGQEQ